MPKSQGDTADRVLASGQALTKGGDTIFALLERQKEQVEAALPNTMSAERLLRMVLTEIRRNPKLGECTPQSLLGALMLAAQLGLEPGALGQVYFVPFGGEVTLIVGYKGLINLALRSPKITSVIPHKICENDQFGFNYGEDWVNHTYDILKPRGKTIGFWVRAGLAGGGSIFRVVPMEEIEKHKARSKAKNDGPWVTDPDAMGAKTAVRIIASYLPLASQAAVALAVDESVTVAQSAGGKLDLQSTVVVGDREEVIDVEQLTDEFEEGESN